jgi:hypothetical protein
MINIFWEQERAKQIKLCKNGKGYRKMCILILPSSASEVLEAKTGKKVVVSERNPRIRRLDAKYGDTIRIT